MINIIKSDSKPSDYFVQDSGLSLEAKGVLFIILSMPATSDCTVEELRRYCSDGIDAITSAVKELEAKGYLTRKRLRDERGHLSRTEYTVNL